MSTQQHPLIRKAIRIIGSQKKLAAIICKSQQTVSRLLNQERQITAEEAVRIEQATKGEISLRDLCPSIHAALVQKSQNTAPHDSLSTQDNGETGERPEQGPAVCAVGGSGKADSAQAAQVVATAGRGKRSSLSSALPASDVALNARERAVR
jgi:DNA-binding transcriptional regulator YdaS (Cro superfamily)